MEAISEKILFFLELQARLNTQVKESAESPICKAEESLS